MTDPLHLLVSSVADLLIEEGHPPMQAWLKAEDTIIRAVEALDSAGAPVGHWLRRVRVFHLRSQGLQPCIVAIRLGIGRTQVHRDYKQERDRRRSAA